MHNPNLSHSLRFLHLVFQMLHARQSWEAERMSWRTVIHLNLVRSVNCILSVLDSAPETETATASRVNLRSDASQPAGVVCSATSKRTLGLAGGDEVHAVAGLRGSSDAPPSSAFCSRYGWAAALGFARQKINHQGKRSLAEDALEVILMSRDDIAALWGDDDVRAALEVRGLRLEDQPGL